MITRREVLRVGAVSVLAPFATGLARSPGQPAARARGVIFLLLQGGPSHHDLYDPKPAAPAEVRGPFKTIATALPGVRFGELLPHTARVASRLAVVRSMQHAFTNHIAGTYVTLTGQTNQPDADREAKGDDFPGPGAVLNYLRQRPRGVPVSVSLPNWLSIPGPSNRMPGQYAGVLGSSFDPFLLAGQPQRPDFRPLTLSLPADVPNARLRSRTDLRQQLDAAARKLDSAEARTSDRFHEAARQLLARPEFRRALELWREPAAVRQRYGMTKLGQSLLLARRLIEAGVTFVAFNEFNQTWDTHGGLLGRYQRIVPPLDQGYAALIDDLHKRGLLDSTLVINAGEFGRTPVMNKDAGRDHWPYAYSVLLAGGGVRGGQVYGASDLKGARVADRPVSPADLLATMWTCLGVSPETELRDRQGRPWALCGGQAVSGLLA